MLLSEVPTPSEVFFGRDSSTRGLAGWIPTQGGVFGQDSDAAKSCRADSGRSGFLGRLSDITNIFGQELDAQEPPSVQMSPDNKFIVQISPENEAASESRPKRRRHQDIEPTNTHSVRISPENAIPVRMPREGLHSRPYTRPNTSNAVATPSSHTGSAT